jgi:hypothetical protein
MKVKPDQTALESASWRISMSMRFGKCVLLGPILALLLLGYSFGAEWEDPPPGQPDQMQSRVDYDPNLSDPFFESNEWGCPEGRTESKTCRHGEPRLKHTAKCFSTSFGGKHEVRFCEARLIDANMIELFINERNPAFNDSLIVQIRNGMFTCQFSTNYIAGPTEGLTWTTKRQGLTLDKKAYGQGDVIKGRIDIEVLDELINPESPDRPPRPITVYGVFKTIVK